MRDLIGMKSSVSNCAGSSLLIAESIIAGNETRNAVSVKTNVANENHWENHNDLN